MFHLYVTAKSGRRIDIDRARHEMDDDLFVLAERKVIQETCPVGFNPFDIAIAERMGQTREVRAQRVWNLYCRAHLERYGEPFNPDVNPHWDE